MLIGRLITHKRLVILSTIAICGAMLFWLGSRYPDLDRKAMMAQSGTVADTLTPWPVLPVDDNMPYSQKVLYTTVNWLDSNKKGMLFGVLFGAFVLTFFRYLWFSPSASRWRQIGYGTLMGAPLGLCVNCSAPVFRGTLQSGRVEMALSAMISSPTLNIIVISMLFSLFPLYIALLKLLAVFICLFLFVPLLGKYLAKSSAQLATPQSTPAWATMAMPTCDVPDNEKWWQSVPRSLRDYGQSLWFIGLRTVPLMFLAGLIGSAVSHGVALDQLLGQAAWWHVGLASAIGTLLPVPMAFDIILVNALYHDGMAPSIVAALLATLGTFSMLSFMVIWTSGLKQLAGALLLLVALVGMFTGAVAHWIHQEIYLPSRIQLMENEPAIRTPGLAIDRDSLAPVTQSQSAALPIEYTLIHEGEDWAIKGAQNLPASTPVTGRFTRMEGQQLGIQRGYRFAVRDFVDPFWVGRGTATGDMNQDGWIDLILATNSGLELYRNRGGWFERIPIRHPQLTALNIYAVAFVDLNNDTALDIFVTSFNQGNYVLLNDVLLNDALLNDNSMFSSGRVIKVPNNQGVITVSPAFADFDGNGFLDIVNGNMALGVVTGSHEFGVGRLNSLVFNNNLEFRDIPIEKTSGETMSTLVSDFNNDGIQDIYFGNDFVIPDTVLLGTGRGFKTLDSHSSMLAYTPFFSMGADSGDINNDLKLDLLLSGTTVTESFVGKQTIDGRSPTEYSTPKSGTRACATIDDPIQRRNCSQTRTVDFTLYERQHFELEQCQDMSAPLDRQSCLLAVMWQLITRDETVVDCLRQFGDDSVLLQTCGILQRRQALYQKSKLANAIRQDNRNLLYLYQDGRYVDINSTRPDAFPHPGGWTWNARLADLDNDGWLDMLNVEGSIRKQGTGWNVVMRNVNGQRFEDKSFSYGFTDDFNQFSFSLIDYDHDGDVDVIANSAEGPVRVYRNDISDHKSIAFSLRDGRGNYYAVGAKIIIEDADGNKQMREIKASGGYQSFDNYRVTFGLGNTESIKRLTVTWPDATSTTVSLPLKANHHYIIERKAF